MLLFLIFVIVILIIFYTISFSIRPQNCAPGPTWYPFVGTMPIVKKLTKTLGGHHLALKKLSEIYNTNVLSLKSDKENIIVVFSYPVVKEVLMKEEFEGRPYNFFVQLRNMGMKKGITITDGKLWKIQRKFVVSHLRTLGWGKKPMEKLIRNEVREVMDVIQENENKEIKIDKLLSISVLNVLWSLIAGSRLTRNDSRLRRLLDLLYQRNRFFYVDGGTLNYFPWLRFVAPEKSGYNLIQRFNEDLKALVTETVEEHFSTWAEGQVDDLIYAFITEMEKDNDPESTFTKNQLLMVCLDLFMGGSTVTNSTLDFCFYTMLLYPEVQQKVRNCINNAFEKHEDIRYDERNRVPYVEAVLNEIERFYHVSPIAGPRKALKDVVVDKYLIPKGTTVLISLYSVHHDKEYWKDPELFRPERFLNSDGNLIHHERFIPFGLGRRRCPGDTLAKSAIFTYFVEIIRSYKLVQHPGSPNLTGKPLSGISMAPEEYKAIFISVD